MEVLVLASFCLWLIILLLPWRPWWISEQFKIDSSTPENLDLQNVTVLVPARNEGQVINSTLQAVVDQGGALNVIVINDNSTDNTQEQIEKLQYEKLKIIEGKSLPEGWSGKLWSLEQGRKLVDTEYTLLLDADVNISKNLVLQLKCKLEREKLDLVSLMVQPPLNQIHEKLLMPAFIYFFKLLYPFRLANSNSKYVAAAAGGCILAKTCVLHDIGGFGSLQNALIDDCTLAKKVKELGRRTWLGLTKEARTVRPYNGIRDIWDMVARTAYNQLHYSPFLLLLCTTLMLLTFIVPLIAILMPVHRVFGLLTLLVLYITFLPTIFYYRVPLWSWFSLPFVGVMYLMMTWTSAIRYWQGEQVRWRGRTVYKNQTEIQSN